MMGAILKVSLECVEEILRCSAFFFGMFRAMHFIFLFRSSSGGVEAAEENEI